MQANNVTNVQYLLSNNINFPATLAKVYVAWDFVVNYLIPVIISRQPQVVPANPTLLTSVESVRKSIVFGRTLLEQGLGRR